MKNIRTFIIIFSIILSSCSGDSEKERLLFKKIHVGMSTTQVIDILGQPDDTTYSIVDSSEFCFTFFTKNKSGLRPSLPDVCFDKNKKVVNVDYGDE